MLFDEVVREVLSEKKRDLDDVEETKRIVVVVRVVISSELFG